MEHLEHHRTTDAPQRPSSSDCKHSLVVGATEGSCTDYATTAAVVFADVLIAGRPATANAEGIGC